MSGEESEAGAAVGSDQSGIKRKRTPRVTSGQIDALLSSLEACPYLHTRRFSGLQGRINFEAGWKEVASELNQLRNGSLKTPGQWMTVWRDLKSRACSKAARLRKEKVHTGNRAVSTAPLTEVERRIVALITASRTPQPASTVKLERSTQNNNLNSRTSVDESYSSSQQDFLAVAESNTESMRMLAAAVKLQGEAAKTQAEASIMFANAADKIAEAAKTQSETLLVLSKTADKIADALIKISEKK